MAKDQAVWRTPLLIEKHQVGEAFFLRLLNHIFDHVVLPLIVLNIWKR